MLEGLESLKKDLEGDTIRVRTLGVYNDDVNDVDERHDYFQVIWRSSLQEGRSRFDFQKLITLSQPKTEKTA